MIVILLIGIIFLAGCVNPTTNTSQERSVFAEYATAHGTTQQETQEFFAETYGINEEKEIWEKLPQQPENFQEYANEWNGINGNSLGETPREVFAQPEFYPTYETSGKTKWVNAPVVPAQTIGIGGTPGIQEATMPEGTGVFDTALFVTSAWGATYYQGMRLAYRVNPETDIRLMFEPEEIVVGPNFPTFSENWAEKVKIRGLVGDIAPGVYEITIYADTPTQEKVEEWRGNYQPYINANGVITSNEGMGTLVLTIVEEEE